MFEITYNDSDMLQNYIDADKAYHGAIYDFTFEGRFLVYHFFVKDTARYVALDSNTGYGSEVTRRRKGNLYDQRSYRSMTPLVLDSIKYTGDKRYLNVIVSNPLEAIESIFRVILPEYGFAVREEQIKLSMDMYRGLVGKQVAICEAEVGTGKTMAYLVASFIAKQRYAAEYGFDLPVTISTSSIELQKMIVEKEIPQLSRMLQDYGLIKHPLSSAIRKGKEHKARVARIIDNAKYTGSDVYDPIIDEDIFEEAAAAKAARQRNQVINECEGIALMRDRIRCGVCGAPMVRHICSKRKVKESWTCANDVCGCRVRISDSDLLMKVTLLMNRIIENADLMVPKPKKRFKDSLTVQRLQGEIDDELAHDQPSEKLIVTRIREIASQLYQETNAKDQIAARIAQKRVTLMSPQAEFNTAYFTDLVENVVLEAPARVTLITKTDVHISEGEPDYGSQENTQEDGDAN